MLACRLLRDGEVEPTVSERFIVRTLFQQYFQEGDMQTRIFNTIAGRSSAVKLKRQRTELGNLNDVDDDDDEGGENEDPLGS